MSYTVHNFQSGDILYSEQLNEMDEQIAQNEASIASISGRDLYQFVLEDGYLTASGTIGAADSSRQEKTTNKILATRGDQLIIDYEIPVEHAMWGCYLLTDSANCPLSREILVNAIGTSFHTEITITDPKAKYIAFSFRSYGNTNAFAVASNNRLNTFEKTFIGYDSLAISNANSLVNSVNHRGYSTLYPENTAIAYEKSAENGFKMVETDIQFTTDGIPVCLHDNTINRTARNSDGSELENTISINDLTYTQALEYDFGIFKGSTFAGTQILSFENFIALCRRLGLHPYIELKNDGNYIAENYVTLVNIVKAYGMMRKVTWIASDIDNLQAILALDAKARLGRVASSITNTLINQMLSLRTSDNEVFIDCKFSALTSESIASLIANDIPLEVWTLDDPSTMRTLDPYVSGCTCNRYAFGAVLAASA